MHNGRGVEKMTNAHQICNLSSMSNQVLSDAYKENNELKTEEKVPVKGLSDKELRRLKRVDLLEMLLAQSKENDALKQRLKEKGDEVKQLQEKIEDRKIIIEEAGTIAEASFQLNGVLAAAENAAKQYLDNIEEMHEKERVEFLKKEKEMEQRCLEMFESTSRRCDELKDETERICSERERETEERCNSLEEKTKRDVERRWNDLAVRVRELCSLR